jgi:SAM-dependent methyltransferase
MSWEEAVLKLRSDPNEAELVRGCYFDAPLTEAAARFYKSGEWSAVRELIGKPIGKAASALDIGAGMGISSFALAKDGFEVTALEPDPSKVVGAGAIRLLAKEAALDIKVAEESAEKLPFEASSFDLVYARQALHHADNLEGFMVEVARVMKKGALFIATRDHVINSESDLELFKKTHPLHKFYGGEHAYKLDEYKGAIKAAGLELTRVIGPYESEINFAPLSEGEFKEAVALRFRPFGLSGILRAAFKSRAIWIIAAGMLTSRDRTPGRLYSFVARKG